MTPTPVGMRCPECSRDRTPVRTLASLHGDPVLTYVLIGINVIAFMGGLLSGVGAVSGGLGGSSVIQDGAVFAPGVADGEVWRLVTGGFLHAGFAHLLFNMFALYILGGLLEPAIGSVRFGLIYFVSLLSGSFGALLLSPDTPTVGASGAVFGLMGAAFVVMRHRGVNPMESGLGIFIGLNLLITFLIPGISIGGHIGGLLGGAVAALLLFDLRDRVRAPAAVAAGLVVAMGALAVTGSIAVSAS
jgi:membrane associated rhomboid family serine protease